MSIANKYSSELKWFGKESGVPVFLLRMANRARGIIEYLAYCVYYYVHSATESHTDHVFAYYSFY